MEPREKERRGWVLSKALLLGDTESFNLLTTFFSDDFQERDPYENAYNYFFYKITFILSWSTDVVS